MKSAYLKRHDKILSCNLYLHRTKLLMQKHVIKNPQIGKYSLHEYTLMRHLAVFAGNWSPKHSDLIVLFAQFANSFKV